MIQTPLGSHPLNSQQRSQIVPANQPVLHPQQLMQYMQIPQGATTQARKNLKLFRVESKPNDPDGDGPAHAAAYPPPSRTLPVKRTFSHLFKGSFQKNSRPFSRRQFLFYFKNCIFSTANFPFRFLKLKVSPKSKFISWLHQLPPKSLQKSSFIFHSKQLLKTFHR